MGSKSSSQQDTQSATAADPQAAADYNRVIRRATQVSNTPYQAYGGELTAGVNSQEQTATNAMNGLGAAANGYYGQAAQQSGLGAAAVNPSAVNGAAISQYESPYQQDVINATMAQINQQNKIQQNQQTSNAIGAGAFGGDRAGLAGAALAGQQALATNSTLAGLNNQNYAQALNEANTQQSVGLGAAQANRAALQQNAETLAGIGSAATNSGLGVANAQLGAGALQQQTQQATDTAQYGQFEQKQAYPFQTEQYLANIVGALAPNYGSSTYGQTTTQTSPLNSIIGAGIGAAALAPGVSSIGSGLSSLGSGLGSFFSLSDRRAKEGLRKIGKAFDGQPIYAFRYKGDPDGRTHLGLVAQEVEKKHPNAVGTLGGLKVVDYAQATSAAADRGHFARGGRTLGDVGFERLTREEVAHLDEPLARADGGVVAGVGAMPFGDVSGYVPTSGGLAPARMLTSPSPSQSPSQPTNPIPNFQQFQQAGQGLGAIGSGIGSAASGLGSAISNVAAFNAPANNYGLPFGGARADGGKVVGLGAARSMRRGYDGGGVVGPVVGSEALAFDPDALGSLDASMQPGLGAAAVPVATGGLGAAVAPTPVPSGGIGLGASPAPAPQGLGAATNDNAAIPVAPALSTLARSYTSGQGAAQTPQATTGGLGAIAAAAPASQDPMGGYAARVRQIESGGDDSQVSSAGATGRYQFMPSTWSDVAAKHPNLGLTSDGITDPGQQETAFKALTADNSAALTKALGRPPTQDELYLAHQQGAAGAIGLLTNPSAPAASIVGAKAVTANGGSADMTAGQFAGMWSARFNGTGGVTGGVPSSALGYAGGVGGAAQPAGGLGSAAPSGLGAANLAASDASATKGGLGSFLGFGAGGNGGLLGLSDDARMGLLGMAAGMMGSTSKSFGVALGQGAQAGLQQYGQALDRNREAGLARAKIANATSEIQNRTALQGIEKDRVTIAGQELGAHLQQIQQEGGNYKSEDAYRKAQAGNEATRTALERYQLFPGPDGSFRYLDKANPGRGLLTAAQVPELAAAGGPSTTAGGGAGGAPAVAGAPAGAGAPASGQPQTAMNGPSALKSDGFMQTGRPTLAAPQGYLPTNWWGNSVRMQSDSVAREAAAAQTKEDVTNAAVAAQKANTAMYYSDEMDKNMDTLAKSGLLQPGAAFPERLNLAKSYNLAAGAIGLPTVDENATAAGQSLIKDQTRLASQLTSSLGSREAASVFSSMMAATPGASNTTAGYKGISSSIRVLAQRDIDRNAFLQNYQARYGSTGEADAAFNALNPAMMYARHAQALAKIPQDATDLIRAHANDPRWSASFEKIYGAGTSRYFTGAQ